MFYRKIKNLLNNEKIVKLIKNDKLKILACIVFIFLIAIFMMSPLIKRKAYFLGDDTEFHRSNIEIIGECIADGNLSRILPDIGNNMGYGVRIFYPNFAHILGGFIYAVIAKFGFTAYDSLKILHFINIFIAGTGMYAFSKKLFKGNCKALISAVFYITLPYFFCDLFMRDALAESMIFMFIPMIFLGIYYLFIDSNKKLFYTCFIIGYYGILNSHLVMTVYFTIFLGIVLLIFGKKLFKRDKFFSLLLASIIVIGLSLPFITSLLQHFSIGGYFITENEYSIQDLWLVNAYEFFFPYYYKTSEYTLLNINLNYIQNVFLLFGILYLISNIRKINAEKRRLYIGIVAFAILSMFFATTNFIWEYMPKMLKNIQFTWRLVAFFGFSASIIAALGLGLIQEKYQKIASAVIILFLIIATSFNIQSIPFDEDYNNKTGCNPDNAMGWQKEYLPQKTKDNLEYIYNRSQDVMPLDGSEEIVIQTTKMDYPSLEFTVNGLKSEIIVEIPRLYYLGYELLDENNQKINLMQNDNGLLSAKINCNGKFILKYNGTAIDKIAKLIQITIIIGIISFVIVKIVKKIRKK